ncbi:MAG: hypothetical protein ABWY12_05780 [Burkholderiales bacterium]
MQPANTRVLPMEPQVGNRLIDGSGEWEVISRPYTTAAGKNAHVRAQLVNNRASPKRKWGAPTSASR